MNGIFHHFSPLSTDKSRGVHLFTTIDPAEALTLSAATDLRRALSDLADFSGLIAESVSQSHGEGKTLEAIRSAFAKAEDVLSRTI